jgi:hypothetical protein
MFVQVAVSINRPSKGVSQTGVPSTIGVGPGQLHGMASVSRFGHATCIRGRRARGRRAGGNTEIAAQLVVGEERARTDVSRILNKLGLRDRTRAVVAA